MKPMTVVTWLVPVVAAAIFFWPPPPGVSVTTMHASGLVFLTIGLWATQAIPEHITGMLFMLLAVLLAIAPPNVVFSGFMSGTLWLVLGGLLLAEAVRATGLGERVALAILGRFTGSYAMLVTGVVVVSTLLMFVMPATLGRVLLLLPVVAGIAKRFGFERGSEGYTGLMLAMMFATFQGGTAVLPANAPNLTLAGAAESLHGITLTYGEYLLVQFPVMGFARLVLIVAATCWLFPVKLTPAPDSREHKPMTSEERRLCVILFGALALWATDFAHGIRPGWIGMGAGLLVILPRVGVLPYAAFNDRIKFGPYFYIGSVLGLGSVISSAGIAQWAGDAALGVLDLEPGQDFRNFMVLAVAAAIACVLATNPAQPGLIAPIAPAIAASTGWPLEAVLMMSAVGFSNVILPFAVPPIIVGLHLAGIGIRQASRYTLTLAVPGFVLLLPLDYLWWRLIGYFG